MNIKGFSVEQLRFQAVWAAGGIPPRLAHASLANYFPGSPEQEGALDKCRAFAAQGLEHMVAGRGLFLQGPVGTGKSHLAVAVLREIVAGQPDRFGTPPKELQLYDEYAFEGYRCCMAAVAELLEGLREAAGNAKAKETARSRLHRLKCDDLVILDDIGADRPSEFAEEQLFALIDLRWRTRRSTIFTSNCTLRELENRIGARSVSRIFEMCEGVRVEGADWRKKRS